MSEALKPKIVICEGPDGCGKTTIATKLASYLDAPVLNSPSRTNSVSFLRKITKYEKGYNAFERQCLHTISNLVDFFEEFDCARNLVLDRSHLSTYIYGITEGADHAKMEVLMDIHSKITSLWIDKYDVHVYLFSAEKRFGVADESHHEKNLSWNNLKNNYALWEEKPFSLFSYKERVTLVQVDGKSIDQIYTEVLNDMEGLCSKRR